MKIRDLMTKTVASCHAETNLAAAGALMWESDCGVLPVVDDRKRVTGVLTDRDVCVALTTRDRRASSLTVGEVVTARAFVCDRDDDVKAALKIMQREKIRRLPVVNKAGMLEGIVSLNDIVLRAGKSIGTKHPDVSFDDIVETLQAICAGKKRIAPGESRAASAA